MQICNMFPGWDSSMYTATYRFCLDNLLHYYYYYYYLLALIMRIYS